MNKIAKKVTAVMMAAVMAAGLTVSTGAINVASAPQNTCTHSTMNAYVINRWQEKLYDHDHTDAATGTTYRCTVYQNWGTIQQICANCGYVYSTFDSTMGTTHVRQ